MRGRVKIPVGTYITKALFMKLVKSLEKILQLERTENLQNY
jgi:hypothetical protein